MKKRILKTTAWLLAILLLLSSLAACAAEPSEGTETTAVVTDAPATEAEKPSSENSAEPTDEPATNSPEDVPSGTETEEDTDGGDVPSGAVTEGATEGDSAPIYTEETDTDADSPDDTDALPSPVDLDGYVYRAFVCTWIGGSGGGPPDPYVFITEKNLDYPQYYPLGYVVYERNMEIERTYDCRIQQVETQELGCYDSLRNAYLSGTTYELTVLPTVQAANCASLALLRDLYTEKSIDVEHPAYNDALIKEFTLGGKLYFIDGAMNITLTDTTSAILFHRGHLASKDFGALLGHSEYNDLYKLVKDGKWTVDAMLSIAATVNNDADGDGTLDPKAQDTVGLFQHTASAQYYFYGCGARISEKGEDGVQRIAYNSPHAKSVFSFLYDRLNVTVNKALASIGSRSSIFYDSENILFTDFELWVARHIFEESDPPYGILPLPKMSETQERYYSYADPARMDGLLWSIPALCENAESASLLLHVLAVYSNRPGSLRECGDAQLLQESEAKNPAARETLRTVHESAVYDVSCNISPYWCDFLYENLRTLSSDEENTYEQAMSEEALSKATQSMNSLLQSFEHPSPPILDENGIAYQLDEDGTYTVIDCLNEHLTQIVIPETVNGRAVTAIGPSAFYHKAEQATVLVLPDSITSISSLAFEGCAALRSVTIPEGVSSIGDQAFRDCTSLESVILPEALVSIGRYSFSGCTSLSSIVIPKTVTQIGVCAFFECTSLSSVVFENREGWDFHTNVTQNMTSPPSNFATLLADPEQAAVFLSVTYDGYTWQIEEDNT